jgi:hypothetical protein
MSNKKITDLTELVSPTIDDVFPVVDIATNTTQKAQLGNLPVQTAVTTALATKQATLVSGTNIKTINSTTLLGSGDIAVQETLVSGTNIKTLNNTSLLGSGNISVVTSPSGVAGAIQFTDGSAFASDATNFFWDDTNNRLGIGTNAPTTVFQVKTTQANTNASIGFFYNNAATIAALTDTGSALTQLQFRASSYNFTDTAGMRIAGGTYGIVPTAMLQVVGSGATSATTSLLVQNSSAVNLLSVNDAGSFSTTTSNFSSVISNDSNSLQVTGSVAAIRVGTSITIEASAILQADSTTKGFLPPRMTTTQRNAIASPATGLVLYDSTTNKLCCYNGSTWNDLF